MSSFSGDSQIAVGEFSLDADRKVLRRGGEIVALPLKAVELLCVLIENRGEVVSKEELISRVWSGSFVDESVLTQNIYLLRKTLSSNGDGKGLIRNVPRRGYVFDDEAFNSGHSGSGDIVIARRRIENIEIETSEQTSHEPGQTHVLPVPHGGSFRTPLILVLGSVAILALASAAYLYFKTTDRFSRSDNSSVPLLKPPTTLSKLKRLAILPVTSSNEKESTFAFGLTRDLSTRLGSFNKFEIAPAGAIHTDFALEVGADARSGRFLADISLSDVNKGTVILSKHIEYNNLIQLEDAIANEVSRAILDSLTPEERGLAETKLPTNFAAYENFEQGRSLWRSRKDGTRYFQKAIELDASYARAYTGLAMESMMGGSTDKAEEYLAKAAAIDENLADIYAAQGFIQIFHLRNWPEAEMRLRHALAMDPLNVNAHHWLAVYFSIHRRLDEAKAEMQTALELDPNNPTLLADMGQLHYFAGENELAVQYCNRALEIDRHHAFATHYFGQINVQAQDQDPETVLRELSSAANGNLFLAAYINVDPKYNFVRDEPAFKAILRRLNFKE